MSRPRLPTTSDFPSNLTLTITPPPNSKPPTNILILLHGLGDTHHPYTRLSQNLNLNETACISLRGPNPIPPLFIGDDATPAFHWGDDVLVDEEKGEIDMDAGFELFRKVLMNVVIKEVLVEKCGFSRRNILFWGFGQGGMAVLSCAAKEFLDSLSPSSLSTSSSTSTQQHEYGGIITIGACLPPSLSFPAQITSKSNTPILVLSGSRSTQVTKEKTERVKVVFGDVEVVGWRKGEDSMPGSREEILPVMKFFGRRLRSGGPEGMVEIA